MDYDKSNETRELTICSESIWENIRHDMEMFLSDLGPQNSEFDKQKLLRKHIRSLKNYSKQLRCEKQIVKKTNYDNIEELSDYLKSHIINEDTELFNVNSIGDNLKDIANNLKEGRRDGPSLEVNYILGCKLNKARTLFDSQRLRSWGKWVKEHCGMSISYCSKIMSVAKLLTMFPKLQNLKGISFTKLYNLRKKIIELFSDESIAKYWPDELCIICMTRPSISEGPFLSCDHGKHYCKKCIVKLMKNRRTIVEYDDEDGVISYTAKIPGKICPECRKEIVLQPVKPTHSYNLRSRI